MNWKILGYKFEVEQDANDGKGFIEATSLTNALETISTNGWLRANYN